MTNIRRVGSTLGLVACLGMLGACGDFLEVEQTIQPENETLFDHDEDFEAALGSAFGVWWGTAAGSRPTNSVQNWPTQAMSALGEELVLSLTTNTSHAYVVQEPRIAYDNDQGGGNWLFRKPFYDLYQCTAKGVDAIRYLNANPDRRILENATRDVTPRARWWARLMNGICHVYAGMLLDQGYTIDESIDTQDPDLPLAAMLKPHTEVTQFGIEQLEMAIEEMEAAPDDVVPVTWINRPTNDLVTKADLIRLAHSMIVRGAIYDARTPEQRAEQWRWDVAFAHLDDAFATEDFYVLGLSPRFDSRYKQYINGQSTSRIGNRLVGPADTTGAYEEWEAADLGDKDQFEIFTPDRRIHGATSRTAGAYVAYQSTSGSSSGGTYRRSRYRSVRWGGGSTTFWNTGNLVTLTAKEMNFIRAEGLIRQGLLDEAATLINAQGRTAVGQLPPATAAGSGTLPGCVPRQLLATTPTCGDIWDVLMYEKRLETHGVEAIIPFADWRGWGMHPEGTICQFALPDRELDVIGLDYYTFGGDWPGSVGRPARANGATCGAPRVGPRPPAP